MSADEESTAAAGARRQTKPQDNGDTGLPAFHTWPKLYTFVLGCFVLWMLLLFALGQCFR